MKVKYENLELEFDIVPFLVTTASRLNIFRKKELLGRVEGEITLVSSNLYALREGTELATPVGVFKAAPLLKPKRDGTAVLIRSGYSVTGVWDVLGQVELGHALGSLCKSFTVLCDYDPNLSLNQNLICFGSPSSNVVSGQVYERLESVINDYFRWGDGYNSFILKDQEFTSGNDGVVLFYDSPWNQNKKILVLSGIGPMGTLGCSRLVSKWSHHVVSRKQRKGKRFIAAVQYDIRADGEQNLQLKRFVLLD
jgi:hypothetical protein